MRKIALLLTVVMIVISQAVSAQTRTVTGTVTWDDDGSTLPGVSIVVKGTSIGAVSDIDGEFTINIPSDENTLVFSFIGMQTIEVNVEGKNNIEIEMSSSQISMDEVMVVAYGTTDRKSFTGSATAIKNEKLEKRVASNITKAIDGQVAGVQTTSGSGQPGSGANIRIRGFGSINSSNAPLYVVDGVPYDGNLNSISSGDIESLTVLKDASAGALYGSRGANGVVIITTKKGEKGKTSVELKASTGFTNRAIKPYATLNTSEYVETVYQGFKNWLIYQESVDPMIASRQALSSMTGLNGIFGDDEQYNFYDMPVSELIDPTTGKINPAANLAYESNWLDEISNKNAMRQEYEIIINGGTDKTNIFSSFSYLDEDGLLKNTNFERFAGRVGVEVEAKPWFEYGGSANFAKTTTDYLSSDGSSSSNVWYSAQFMSPLYPIYERESNGDLILDQLDQKQFDYGINRPSGANPNFNSVATLYEDESKVKYDNMSGRFHADLIGDGIHNIIRGLSITTNLGFDYVNSNRHIYYNPDFGNAVDAKGRLAKTNSRTFSYTWNQLLKFEREFGDHKINFLAGHENHQYKYNYFYGEKTGFPFPGIVELAAGATTADLTSYEDNYAVESYLSNISYDYMDKYYLSMSFRADASSRFHEDNRWGNFWSVGASWRVTEERFMDNVSFINNLKLKASYGLQGNDNISTDDNNNFYAWQSLYSLDNPNASLGGVMLSELGNPDIKWEENLNLNVGLETRIFNIADITLEYYNRKTIDMLMQRPMPLSTGFDSYWDNVGEMLNKGIEFSTNIDVIKASNFEWNAIVNVATIHNEILKIDNEKDQIVNGIRINKVGEAVNSFYLATSAGVDPTSGAQLYEAFDIDETGVKGPTYITDRKDKATVSKVIAGSRIPDFYGSFGSDFIIFNDFDVSFLTTFSVGGYIYDYIYNSLMNPIYVGSNYHKNTQRAWRKPGDITDIPRIENGTGFSRAQTNADLIDASYFAIKNITVGYTLPSNICKKINMEKIRVFVTLDNLALFSHLDGMDPQYNFSGSTDFDYAPVKTTLFGINVKF